MSNKNKRKKGINIEIIAISFLVLLFCGIGIWKYMSRSKVDTVSDNTVSTNEVIDLPVGFGEVIEEVNEPENEKAPVQIVAHRGYCSVAPENTMQSFVRGIDASVDMIELDVQMTKDGYIVVFHDLNLNRIVGDKKCISDYTYAELLNMDFGSYKSSKFTGLSDRMMSDCYKGEKIVTLDEVLAYFNGDYVVTDSSDIRAFVGEVPGNVLINLELKDLTNFKGISKAQKDTFAAAVVSRVYAYGLQDRVVFASFNHDYLDQIEALNPDNYTLCVTENGDADWLLEHYPADCYSMSLEVVSDYAIERFHVAGAPVYVWTANTSDSMRYALSLDADGIITNYPGIASVLIHDEYLYLRENYAGTYTAPGIYDYADADVLGSYVMSGFSIVDPSKLSTAKREAIEKDKKNKNKKETVTDNEDKDIPQDPLMVVSAYDSEGEKDSVLYIMSMDGVLLNIIDLGIKGDINSLAYDADDNILWVSCRDEYVYALDWEQVCTGDHGYDIGKVRESINSGGDTEDNSDSSIIALKTLYKASSICGNGVNKVNFIAFEDGYLYIGASLEGGKLYKVSVREYVSDNGVIEDQEGIEDNEDAKPYVLELTDTYSIPDGMEGVSFKYEAILDSDNNKDADELNVSTYLVMTRRKTSDNQDSELIYIQLEEDKTDYTSFDESYVIPERAMQPYVHNDKIYLPFQSASRPYLHSSRVFNDQIWVVDGVAR